MFNWPPEHLTDVDDPASLISKLKAEVDKVEEQWRLRWGPDEEHQLYRDIAEAFRPSIPSLEIGSQLTDRIRVLHEEVGTPADGLTDIASFVHSLTSHPIVQEGIEIRYAHEALERLQHLGTRLAHLLELIAQRHLSPKADEFLRRATRLYLWGFEEETIVLCAASLEAAYRDRFPDATMSELQIKKRLGSERFDTAQYLRAARASGVFSKRHFEIGHTIRLARNDAVHPGPLEGDTSENRAYTPARLTPTAAVAQTAELLEKLFPPGC